ncbi:RplF [Acrasis kona]|uniref:RplF n=1 Tax=Acrasis kona TaxID=1008807 RepID=A0AAW2ZE33_9EUKA
MKRVAARGNRWKGSMNIDTQIKQDLTVIQNLLSTHNCTPFELDTHFTPVSSDATTTAYGGVYEDKIIMGRWPTDQEELSINMYELIAFEKTLDLIIQKKTPSDIIHLHVFTDNT